MRTQEIENNSYLNFTLSLIRPCTVKLDNRKVGYTL
nr:MAG TPA: hypothetical protein [Caudoviricetes sp.]